MLLLPQQPEAHAQTIDPAAPLEILKKARETAAQSNMDAASATSGLASFTNVVVVAFTALGILLAGFSGHRLWKNVKEGDQARETNGQHLIGLVVGALLTIIGVIVGAITNFATG